MVHLFINLGNVMEDTLKKQNQSLIKRMIKQHEYIIKQAQRTIEHHEAEIKDLQIANKFLELVK